MKHIKKLERVMDILVERGKTYNTPKENFKSISDILDTNYGIKLTPSEICKVFIATKISREKFKHKLDNTDDLIGYIAIDDELQ